MSNSEILLNNLHKILRKDEYLKELLKGNGIELDILKEKIILLSKEYLFSTMSYERILELEKELDYKTKSSTLEGKRIEIEARWKSTGKSDLELLQTIANSWRNGEIEVKFINGIIEIYFVSLVGIPSDIDSLKFMLEEAKPAHLGINFTFRYRTWGMLPPRTWRELSQYTWDEIVKKEGI